MIHPAKFAALLSIATAIECHCHVVIPAVTIIVGAAINKEVPVWDTSTQLLKMLFLCSSTTASTAHAPFYS